MPWDNQKLVIFDDYLNTGAKMMQKFVTTLLIPEIRIVVVSI